MKKKIFIIVLFQVLLFIFAGYGKSVRTQPGEIVSFLPTALNVGMGGANSALVEGINSLSSNVAGLANLRYTNLLFSHRSHFADVNIEYFAMAYPFKDSEYNLGFDFKNLNSGKIQRTGLNANDTGYTTGGFYTNNEKVAGIYYGVTHNNNLNIGVGVKYLRSELDDKTAVGEAFSANAGLQKNISISPVHKMVLSAELRNMSSSIKYDYKKEKIPMSAVAGAGIILNMKTSQIKTEFDIEFPENEDMKFYMGLNWHIRDILSIRSGFDSENDAGSGFSFGLGTNIQIDKAIKTLSIDYALSPYGDLGYSHLFTVSAKFGSYKDLSQESSLHPSELFDEIVFLILEGDIDTASKVLNKDINDRKLLSQKNVKFLQDMLSKAASPTMR